MSASYLRLSLPSNHLQHHKGAVASSDIIINNMHRERHWTESEIIRGGQKQGHRHVTQLASAAKIYSEEKKMIY